MPKLAVLKTPILLLTIARSNQDHGSNDKRDNPLERPIKERVDRLEYSVKQIKSDVNLLRLKTA